MKKATVWLALLFVGAGPTANAHSRLRSSMPAQNSTVAPPTQVVLGFSEISQLTAMTLLQGSGPALKVAPLPQHPAQQLTARQTESWLYDPRGRTVARPRKPSAGEPQPSAS